MLQNEFIILLKFFQKILVMKRKKNIVYFLSFNLHNNYCSYKYKEKKYFFLIISCCVLSHNHRGEVKSLYFIKYYLIWTVIIKIIRN